VVLLCQQKRLEERRISRLIRGNPSVIGEIVYEDFADALAQLKVFIPSFLTERADSILPSTLK
jgi:hypothetical protein